MDAIIVVQNPTHIAKKMVFPKNLTYNQSFSLSPSIIYYIALNPSTSNVYLKLTQSCKYFFKRNPIFNATNMDKESICSWKRCFKVCCIKIDINLLSSRIWLTSKLILYRANPSFMQLLRPKLYRSKIKKLAIHDTKMIFDDYKFLVCTCEIICLTEVKITHKNGSTVKLENIIEVIPYVTEFLCTLRNYSSTVSASTAKNIANLKNLQYLRKLTLVYLPETFNIDDLFDFSKKFLKQKQSKSHYHGFKPAFVIQTLTLACCLKIAFNPNQKISEEDLLEKHLARTQIKQEKDVIEQFKRFEDIDLRQKALEKHAKDFQGQEGYYKLENQLSRGKGATTKQFDPLATPAPSGARKHLRRF